MRQAIASNEGGLNELNPVDIHIMTEKKCGTVRAENARTSSAMILNVYDLWVIVFHEEGFQVPMTSQYQKMITNVNMSLCYPKQIQHNKG